MRITIFDEQIEKQQSLIRDLDRLHAKFKRIQQNTNKIATMESENENEYTFDTEEAVRVARKRRAGRIGAIIILSAGGIGGALIVGLIWLLCASC